MDLRLALGLVGAGLGGLASYNDGGDKYDIATGAAVGAGTGSFAGNILENIANAFYRHKQLDTLIGALPDVSQQTLKKLVKAYAKNGTKLPIYIQTSGEPYGNAFYTDDGVPAEFNTLGWKNLLTGKKVTNVLNEPSTAVYIGSDYKKLPVVAHELGHASDLQNRSWLYRNGDQLMHYGAVGATLGSWFIPWNRLDAKQTAYTAGTIATAALLLHAGSSWLRRKHERDASNAAMSAMKTMLKPKQLEPNRQLLEAAYSTYEPVQIFKEEFQPDAAIAKK